VVSPRVVDEWDRLDQRIIEKFLQRVSIACYAERCTSYSKYVRPSVRLSVRPTHAGIMQTFDIKGRIQIGVGGQYPIRISAMFTQFSPKLAPT